MKLARMLLIVIALNPSVLLAWTTVAEGQVFKSASKRIWMKPPAGWMCETHTFSVRSTRDGPLLNEIILELRPHRQAFRWLKKPMDDKIPLEDLAELFLADIRAREGVEDVTVISVEPAALADLPAFRVHLTFRAPRATSGATHEIVAVGAPTRDGLLIASYTAPKLNFFAKSLPAFESTLATVQMISAHKK